MVYRSVAFGYPVICEACFREMPVHVAREDESALTHLFRALAKNAITCMRRRVAIEIEPVPVEAPGQLRIVPKSCRISDILEVNAVCFQRWISLPATSQ